MIRSALVIVGCVAVLAGCGGDEEPAVRPGTPAVATPDLATPDDIEATPPATPPAVPPATAQAPAAKVPPAAPAIDTSLASQDSTQLQREVFSYRGAGRDPFFSLLKSADIRPLVGDVRVMGITYDAAYPARSVAVLRDTAQRKRYSVRTGDELGLMRVTQIRVDAVVVTLDEFGVERQVVLSVRRRPEERP